MDNLAHIVQSPFRNFWQGMMKIKSFIPIYGVKGTFELIIKNVILFEEMVRLEKDLGTPDPRVEPKVPIVVTRYSGEDISLPDWVDRAAIVKIRGEYGLEQFQKRLNRGDFFYAAFWEEKFIGFLWLEFPPSEEAGYPLLSNEAYTYDGWTFEEYRGKRALPVLQQAAMNDVREHRQDIRTLVTHIATWNKPSLSGDQRAGYKITRMELTVVLLGYHRKFPLGRPVPSELVMHY